MNRVQQRRGPDDEGLHSWPHATLGHRRLSIFDLSHAGHQPMLSPCGQIGVVFNGAIYNFRELRAELVSHGYRFKSQTDTEVLVHGFEHWGVEALVRRLRGMFAIAIYDARDDTLWLVRDCLGVKPLVYAEKEGNLWFASSTRALRAANTVNEIDPRAMLDVLRAGCVYGERSIYRGASKLAAGTILCWRHGKISLSPYWSPLSQSNQYQSNQAIRYEDAVAETERLLVQAVTRRLDADVPVATLLSAGIDSSLVSWAIGQAGADVVAYTVGVPNDPTDEADAARETAVRIGLEHHVLPMVSPQFSDLDEVTSAYAEPFAIESSLGMLRISRLIKPNATVVLTGDGGDDIFLGYERHRHLLAASAVRRYSPRVLWPSWRRIRDRIPRGGIARRAAALMDYAADGVDAYWSALDRTGILREQGILSERLSVANPMRRADPSAGVDEHDVLGRYLALAYATQFVGEYLPKVDGATMYHGLEARSPLLDQDLWEFGASLPYDVRMRRGELKSVLRTITANRLGDNIANRAKQGFHVPVKRWMAGAWHKDITALIDSSKLAEDGWVNRDRWRQAHLGFVGSNAPPVGLWHLLMLEKWYRQECERFGASVSVR